MNIKAILKKVLRTSPLPEDQLKVVIPAIDNPSTEIDEADLPEFFEQLAKNPAARKAFLAYYQLLLTKPRKDELSKFFEQYILPNLKDSQKPSSSRRK
jgi:hypothetical protein